MPKQNFYWNYTINQKLQSGRPMLPLPKITRSHGGESKASAELANFAPAHTRTKLPQLLDVPREVAVYSYDVPRLDRGTNSPTCAHTRAQTLTYIFTCTCIMYMNIKIWTCACACSNNYSWKKYAIYIHIYAIL
mgnify:CR=1 FL=1